MPLHVFIFTRQCENVSHAPLPSARQHPSYGDCLEVKREYYQNSSVMDCVTQCSQSAAHLCEQFLQVKQIGFVTLGPLRCAYRGGCLALYYCITWWSGSGGIQAWSLTTNWFPSVLWHCWFGHLACKIVPEMTYYVSSGTLNPTHSLKFPMVNNLL